MTDADRPVDDPVDELVDGVRSGDRAHIGRAITLVESTRADHQEQAQRLLVRLLPHAGGAHRVGITGVPGVGKSTFIETLGTDLTEAGHRVAVLAVDPSSGRTGGSILGDKTRMPALAVNPAAFIRPSPSSGTLGGVTRRTRETITVLEAADYDIVLVETVGVGQSETVVAEMVDFFLVLMLPGAGDDLQGIKKGVLELADMIAVNKADGDNVDRARRAARDYQAALRLLQPATPTWNPPVVTCSGLTDEGLDTLWDQIELHRRKLIETGEWDERRRRQLLDWVWSMATESVLTEFTSSPEVAAARARVEPAVLDGTMTPTLAAAALVQAHRSGRA